MESNENSTYHIPFFEWAYFFIMVIYMAQATPETSRMVGSLSGDVFPFALPIILTLILLKRHPISFVSKGLGWTLLATLVWSFMIALKYSMTSTEEYSYIFFLFYGIIIAYIHVRVFGKDLLYMYEKVMIVLSVISVFLWLPTVLEPDFARSLYSVDPKSGYGYNLFYLYTYMADEVQRFRNAGCSWEPGRFAIMVILAIYCNLMRRGLSFIRNKGLWVLLIALASTMSTTGYSVALVLFLLFYIKSASTVQKIFISLFTIPLACYLFTLDFMGSKIDEQLDDAEDYMSMDFSYVNENYEEGEYVYSMGRFTAMAFEWVNIKEDPILGYSRNNTHSFFYQNFTTNVVLTGGILKVIGHFGIPLALFFYIILLLSSIKLSKQLGKGSKSTLFWVIILSSISYNVFCVPIFMAFWMYGIFTDELDEEEYEEIEEDEDLQEASLEKQPSNFVY